MVISTKNRIYTFKNTTLDTDNFVRLPSSRFEQIENYLFNINCLNNYFVNS